MTRSRRPVWRPGTVVRVALGDGWHTYGILREVPLVAIFDCRTQTDIPVSEVLARPVLFSVWVQVRALSLWPSVGTSELPPRLRGADRFVKRDAISGRTTIYVDEGIEQPATSEELTTLEVAAVWDPEHVVDRIVDHYAGRPNKWEMSLRNGVRTGDGKVRPA